MHRDVVRTDNHLTGPVDTARAIHFRALGKKGRFLHDLVVEDLCSVGDVVTIANRPAIAVACHSRSGMALPVINA